MLSKPSLRSVLVFALLAFAAGCDRHEAPVAPPHLGGFAIQSAGGKIAFTSGRDGNNEIYVMNTDGSGVTRLTNNPAVDQDPAWSPDGTRLAFTSTRDGNYELYVMNADGSGVTRLTTDPAKDAHPAWCGTRIAFESDRYFPGMPDVYVMNDDGTGLTRLTISTTFDQYAAWSPSCEQIAYSVDPDGVVDGQVRIYVMNADGSGAHSLVSSPGKNRYPAWSPDGTRIAFTTDRDTPGNSEEIYVMNADGTQQTRLTVRTDFHRYFLPAWSSDGTRIAFQASSVSTPGTYVMNADGSGVMQLADGVSRPAWFGAGGSPASGEPVFNTAASDSMIFQDTMDEYTTPQAMDTWPAPSFHPYFPEDTHYAVLNRGRNGSGEALRVAYVRGNDPAHFQDPGFVEERPLYETWPENNVWYSPPNAAFVVQYWFRISKNGGPGGSPGYGGTDKGMKWMELWRDGHGDRSQIGVTAGDATTGPLWHLNAAGDDPALGDTMGVQPVGPYWNQLNDNQWHRATYLYQPATSLGAQDGIARMWIDGTKIVDVSAPAAGLTPPGGTRVWCTMSQVGRVDTHPTQTIHLGEYINGYLGDNSGTDLPMALDFDDFKWWKLPARVQ